MPKFEKTLEQLESRFDKWLYVLKNLERLHDIPEKFRDRIFRKLFAAAEIAKFTPEEASAYEDSLKVYRDLKNSIDTAREEGKIEVALNMLADGLNIESIIKYTGLTAEQIERLRRGSNKVKEPAASYTPARKPRARKQS